MADAKISALTGAGALDLTEMVPIVQGTDTKKVGLGVILGQQSVGSRPTAATFEAFNRNLAVDNLATLLSGRLSMRGIWLPVGATVTNIVWVSATTALATGSNQWAALFSPARAQLAISADGTSGAWAANAIKSFAMTTPYVVTASGLYYLGLCVVATTVPTLVGNSATVTVAHGLAPILAGTADTGLTNPASCPATAAALTPATAASAYGYVN